MNKIKYYIIAWLQGRKAATTFAIERQIGDLKKYDRRKERSWIYWNNKIMTPWNQTLLVSAVMHQQTQTHLFVQVAMNGVTIITNKIQNKY